ncbi:hypothetical protein SAMN05444972_101403 [Marininema halotolerans]|uniref:Uncharacterized protein n=1 Tax=Marininema halotolerans TaxID=1155944 RepID=A0A1I6P7B7_9BACL|nr:hypothetical protein SAMN05444972_101403 [Marininema halotolerans]
MWMAYGYVRERSEFIVEKYALYICGGKIEL